MTALPQVLQKMAVLLIRKALKINLKLSKRQYVKFCQLKWPPFNSKFHKTLIQIVFKAQTSIGIEFYFKKVRFLVATLTDCIQNRHLNLHMEALWRPPRLRQACTYNQKHNITKKGVNIYYYNTYETFGLENTLPTCND